MCCTKRFKCFSILGGLPVVIFLGDDVQLPPVLDTPVYKANSKSPAGMHGALVWKEFNEAVLLKTVVHQAEDQTYFKNVLGALREYKLTQDHATWLQKFQWGDLLKSHGQSFIDDMDENSLFVFPTHNEEWLHNKTKILKANERNPIAKVDAISHGSHAKGVSSENAKGLLPTVYLCIGCKVMLTTNLHVKFGLFNGSTGTVVEIIYPEGKTPKDCQPVCVMVKFQKYTGPPFVNHDVKIVPITPIKRKIDCFCYSCSITQIPLRLGWGTTIHRCQGMTIGEGESSRYIVINPGTRKFESLTPGALFVALSRAKTAGDDRTPPDFAWHPAVLVNQDRLCHIVNTPTTRARDLEIKRIQNLSNATFSKYSFISKSKILHKFRETTDLRHEE